MSYEAHLFVNWKMRNRILIYEKLNLLTLCCSIFARYFYRKQYFIDYSILVKKYCCGLVDKMEVEQLHHNDFLGKRIQPRVGKKAIEMANRFTDKNPKLVRPFTHYLKDRRARSLLRQIIVNSIVHDVYKYVILKEFIKGNRNLVCYFPITRNFIFDHLRHSSEDFTVTTWHSLVLSLISIIKKAVFCCVLFATPFYSGLQQVKSNRIVVTTKRTPARDVIYFHPRKQLVDKEHFGRDMYFLNSNILEIRDCIHLCDFGPMSPKKEEFLKRKGGVVLNLQKQEICVRLAVKRLFIDFYRCFFIHLPAISFQSLFSFQGIKGIINLINNSFKAENFLQTVDVKLALFENDQGMFPALFTLLGNRRGIKTATCLHGYGGLSIPDHTRSNTVVNYYLVPGKFYDK